MGEGLSLGPGHICASCWAQQVPGLIPSAGSYQLETLFQNPVSAFIRAFSWSSLYFSH